MQFDIEEFYLRRGIDYITKGTNVKKGEINISCPFCNDSSNPDPSYHLGVAHETGYWSCWRNRKHRGKRLHRLIMKVARVSYSEACDILGQKVDWIKEGSFSIFAEEFDSNDLFSDTVEEQEEQTLEMPKEFLAFKGYRSQQPFEQYLIKGRGFHRNHVQEVLQEYNFHYCIEGKWNYRLILPITLEGELLTWTGRSLAKDATLRYRSLSEKEGALASIKDLVFHYDKLIETGGRILFITEGPFDAMKVDFYAKDQDCRATALFSKALRQPQAYLLAELANVFDTLVILLDAEELESSLISDGILSFLGDQVVIGELPEGYHDPGELTSSAVYKLIERYS